jgi:hypothetical protein
MTSVPTHNKPTSIFKSFDSFYNVKKDTCLKYKKVETDFIPKINQLSEDSVLYEKYAKIYVYGENFMPNGITTIQIGDQNIKVTYYNSNVISFEMTSTIFPGEYDIYVKNNVTFKAINVTGRSNSSVRTSNKMTFIVQI